MEPIVRVRGLRKRYGSLAAVDDVSFDVQRGEILGIVGPNGAGKTTTVECILGLTTRDGGLVEVFGQDPADRIGALRERVGVQLQAAELQDRLRVHEAVELFASLYPKAEDPERLIAQWGLTERRNTAFGDLSGGQKQRLFITLALVNRPELVVLDELTTGLDPQARRATWDLVRAVRDRGATVILVTHFMDEAELLCDRVAVIDTGKVRALDTPASLIAAQRSGARVRFTAPTGFDAGSLRSAPGVERVDQEGSQVIVSGHGPLLVHVAARLATVSEPPLDFRADQSTLEDVFLALTGREVRD
jgi:ABC-2 type transport system ATP-binding protein